MDAKTIQFFLLCLFSVICIAAGYQARKRAWVKEETSRSIHWVTIVMLWSTGGLLSLWNLDPVAANMWILLIQPILVGVPAYLAILIGKRIGLTKPQVGVLAIGAGTANSGFTLGAYLCYAQLPSPKLMDQLISQSHGDAEQLSLNALAYGVLTVMTMSASTVLLLFPVAYKLGDHTSSDMSLGRVIYKSFVDFKAVMFYMAAVGITLAYLKVPFPAQVIDWHILTFLFYVGAATAYFGVGLRLHLDQLRPHLKSHLILTGVRFAAVPLMTAGIFGLIFLASRFLDVPAPPPLMVQSLLLLSFMPSAIQVVILSNLFHLDARMASSVWVVNTLLFLLIPLPILMLVIRWI